MKMKYLVTFFISIIILLPISEAHSQTGLVGPYFWGVDYSKFPTIKVNYTAKMPTNDFANYDFITTDFTVNENNNPTNFSVDCGIKADTPGVFVMILIDKSQSMETLADKEYRSAWVKEAVNAFIDSLFFIHGTQVAMIGFSSSNQMMINFTGDEAALHQAINSSVPMSGPTNFFSAFTKNIDVIGSMKTLNPEIPRYLIVVSDGVPAQVFSTSEQTQLLQKAVDAKTIVFSMTCVETVDYELSQLVKNSGGVNLPGNTKKEFIANFRYIASMIQSRRYCQLIYQTNYGCDEQSRDRSIYVKCNKNDVVFNKTIKTEVNSVAGLTASTDELLFGKIGAGEATAKLTLTAKGVPYNINKANFSIDKNFYVKDWGGTFPPFTLSPGTPRELTIEYIENPTTESHVVNMDLSLDNPPCPFIPVKLVTSCGGTAVDQEFGNVEVYLNNEKTFNCIFKNTTQGKLPVTVSVTGTNPGDFIITQGGGDRLIDADGCLDLKIKFAPSGEGDRTATIEFKTPAQCPDAMSNIKGTGLPSYVEENYFDAGNTISLRIEPNNPNNIMKITFESNKSGNIRLDLYDIMGQIVDVLVDKSLGSGQYNADYSVSNLTSGVYILRLQAGNRVITKRIVVTK